MRTGELRRTRVKICGVTNRADAEQAIALGADALGFNTFSGSKRFVDLQAEALWVRDLAPLVTKIAVMVNPTIEEVENVFRSRCIDVVQFHGDEDEAFCAHFAKLHLPFIKAVRVSGGADPPNLDRFHTRHVLLDAHVPGAFGGTGSLIDLEAAARLRKAHPDLAIVLSGGLTPGNVRRAVEVVHPFAVDVASGVEREPRRKDPELMRQFIASAQP